MVQIVVATASSKHRTSSSMATEMSAVVTTLASAVSRLGTTMRDSAIPLRVDVVECGRW